MINANRFEELVRKTQDTMYRTSMSMLKNEQDACDCVQNAVLKAYENLHKLRNEEYFKTWLIRILINECKRAVKVKSRTELLNDTMLPEISSRDNPYLSVEIAQTLDSLPQKIRLVVIMFYVEDYTIKEIGQVLGIPEGTVKSRLNKGRTLLKEMLV